MRPIVVLTGLVLVAGCGHMGPPAPSQPTPASTPQQPPPQATSAPTP
jgi:hypothetical protein